MSSLTDTSTGAVPLPQDGGDRIVHGAVHLDVTRRDTSLEFWRDAVGLTLLDDDGERLVLGAGERPLIVLHPGAQRPMPKGVAGLYHLAIHMPTPEEFARTIVRLAEARVGQAPTDHIFSMATYATAPDNLGLEITLETPERMRSFSVHGRDIRLIDDQGNARGPVEALDVDAVMTRLPDIPAADSVTSGAFIGHVHVHVGDLPAAVGFYRDVIGFDEHMVMPDWGMADLTAGGRFPHRMAMNTWMGPGVTQAPAGTAGLREFELRYPDEASLRAALDRAAAAGAVDGDLVTDPAGNRIRVGVRTA